MANPKLLDRLFSGEGITSANSRETEQLGREVSSLVERGTVISLEGPLGAGKTQFSKGVVAALGCNEEATSPSFTLVHEYVGGRLPMHHFDFYRLESPEELNGAGYDDCLVDGGIVVEWGDKFPEVLPSGTIRLRFEILPEGGRRIRGIRTP
ncbi:MAG TPA: tRNA (adenosine(37)-N6)-threonylcarbamoyltransferase complex ATPase subunit type 1 TsaE [Terrimicrobiaceae bacterium]